MCRDTELYASDNTAVAAPAVAAWLEAHSPLAAGFSASLLARVAVIFSLNSHGISLEGDADGEVVYALFETSSKFAHSCDENAAWRWTTC